jgi:hypothetical protein
MTEPRIIPVGEEPPPLNDSEPRRNGTGHRRDKAKGTSGTAKRRTGERFALLNAFADATLATLDRAEIAVWLLLWRDTKPNGLAHTSQADLARRAGVNPRTIRRALAALQRAGLVVVVHRGGLPLRVSAYRVHALTIDDSHRPAH